MGGSHSESGSARLWGHWGCSGRSSAGAHTVPRPPRVSQAETCSSFFMLHLPAGAKSGRSSRAVCSVLREPCPWAALSWGRRAGTGLGVTGLSPAALGRVRLPLTTATRHQQRRKPRHGTVKIQRLPAVPGAVRGDGRWRKEFLCKLGMQTWNCCPH